jgi:Alternative complex III, ActD subunit
MGVLGASLRGFFLLLILCGLPELSSPIFSAEGFESATNDRFWVAVDARDPAFDGGKLRIELLALGATRVSFAGMDGP